MASILSLLSYLDYLLQPKVNKYVWVYSLVYVEEHNE